MAWAASGGRHEMDEVGDVDGVVVIDETEVDGFVFGVENAMEGS